MGKIYGFRFLRTFEENVQNRASRSFFGPKVNFFQLFFKSFFYKLYLMTDSIHLFKVSVFDFKGKLSLSPKCVLFGPKIDIVLLDFSEIVPDRKH